jgi:hypothetical protein
MTGRRRGVHIVDPDGLPEINDGGCGTIELVFDVASEQIVSLECQGSA